MGGTRPDSRRVPVTGVGGPVCEPSARAVPGVGVLVGQSPVVRDTKRTRFTPGLKSGVLSLSEDSRLVRIRPLFAHFVIKL